MKKLFYLFLALLLPALIFVFLKYAGKNEFNIPVYYDKGVEQPLAECDRNYPIPYLVPDAPWDFSKHKATVMVFPSGSVNVKVLEAKIIDEFGTGIVRVMGDFPTSDSVDIGLQKKCIFLMKDPLQTVLVDDGNRIRGYYDLRLREEEDRLRVELKVLLKKY